MDYIKLETKNPTVDWGNWLRYYELEKMVGGYMGCERCKKMEERLEKLEEEIKYMPGGIEYERAKEDFAANMEKMEKM